MAVNLPSEPPRRKISPRWSAILVWALAFIAAETFGSVFISSIATTHGVDTIEAYSLSQAGTMVFRTVFLIILSSFSVLGLKEAVHKPVPNKSKTIVVITIGTSLIFLSNFLVGIQTSGAYHPQLLGAFYFLNRGGAAGFLFGFPIQVAYYLSEIVMMNYMYILAKKGWSWRKGPITSGTMFLILGWAALHAITKDIFVAIDGVILVLIFYVALEYAGKAPIAPIILWFAQLIL